MRSRFCVGALLAAVVLRDPVKTLDPEVPVVLLPRFYVRDERRHRQPEADAAAGQQRIAFPQHLFELGHRAARANPGITARIIVERLQLDRDRARRFGHRGVEEARSLDATPGGRFALRMSPWAGALNTSRPTRLVIWTPAFGP